MKDIYLYDCINVLRNKLNIMDEKELETVEADFLLYRILELENLNIGEKIDVEYLKQIHFYLFQDIYEWAGEFREIDIEKYERTLNGLSVKYIEFSKIENELNSIFEFINKNDINKMNKKELAEYVTDIVSNIWKVHPFRERKY